MPLKQDHDTSPEQILHVAQSLFHDVVPAAKVGLPTAWIDRQDLEGGGSLGRDSQSGSQLCALPPQAFADWAITAKQAAS